MAALLLVRQAMGWPGHDTLPRPVAGFVGLSGVYDVDEHYHYEARRHVLFLLLLVACLDGMGDDGGGGFG